MFWSVSIIPLPPTLDKLKPQRSLAANTVSAKTACAHCVARLCWTKSEKKKRKKRKCQDAAGFFRFLQTGSTVGPLLLPSPHARHFKLDRPANSLSLFHSPVPLPPCPARSLAPLHQPGVSPLSAALTGPCSHLVSL